MNKKKILKVLLIAIVPIFAFCYFYLFFQKGIVFEDTFLKLSKEEDGYQFQGSAYGEKIEIVVSGDIESMKHATVSYRIGETIDHTYLINAVDQTIGDTYIEIYEEEVMLFQGYYSPNSFLLDKNRDVYMDDFLNVDIIAGGEEISPFDDKYQISKNHIIDTVFKENVENRGNEMMLFIAIIVLILYAIDAINPLFFFNLKHAWDVKNPEPSDYYLFMQKISRIIIPFIILGILIGSLINH